LFFKVARKKARATFFLSESPVFQKKIRIKMRFVHPHSRKQLLIFCRNTIFLFIEQK